MKKTSTAVAVAKITTTDLESAGIKTSLNQGDIVDILAEETYNGILARVDALNERTINLGKKVSFMAINEAEVFAKELHKMGVKGVDLGKEGFAYDIRQSREKDTVCDCYTVNAIQIKEYDKSLQLYVTNRNSSLLYPKTKTPVEITLSFL